MLVLRATQKVLRLLPQSAGDEDVSDTALGDWYINRTVIDRQPLLLCVSSNSLLALLTPASDVKSLPGRFPKLVAQRLELLGIDAYLIASELTAMQDVRVGRTLDRSVLGTMVDFAKVLPYYLTHNTRDTMDFRLAERRFSETPCRCGSRNAIWPHSETLRLLTVRWQNAE